jgi:hypothetical protein
MNQKIKSTIKSLLGVKGGKVAKQEKSCLCGHCCFPDPVDNIQAKKPNLTSIKGGKGKTSTVQTVNVQKMIEAKMPTVGFTPRRAEFIPCGNGKCRSFEQINMEVLPCGNGGC